MTALEYMEKQVCKHSKNYVREWSRGVPEEMLRDILVKMLCYAEAAEALRKVEVENG